MDRLEKLISNNIDVVFIIALIEAILIVVLISYIMYMRWYTKGDGRKLNYPYGGDWGGQEQNRGGIVLGKDAYYKQSYPKKEYTKAASSRMNPSSPISTNKTGRTEGQASCSDDGMNEYLANEREKITKYRETKNDDGTVRTEIVFDMPNDKPVSAPILRYDYLEAANSGQFRRLLSTDEKCFFRTWEEDGIRKFEFHGNVDKALANINAIFDETCEIEGKQNGATNIINVEPGIIDNNLKVEKKSKIKLI
jgi:hypothetical protein